MLRQNKKLVAVLAVLVTFIGVFYWQASSARSESQGNWGMADAKEINVNSKVAGRVVELLVDEGDYVEEGQVIARLDTDTQSASYLQAAASLGAQQGQIAEARAVRENQRISLSNAVKSAEANEAAALAARDLAAREESRYGELLAAEAVPAQTYDVKAEALKTAEAALAAARAKTESARADLIQNDKNEASVAAAEKQAEALTGALQNVQVSLDEAVIRAPFSELITKKYVEEGQLVSTTVPLFALQDTGDNWIDFKVRETELASFPVGREVEIEARDGKTRLTGTVESVRRKADFATQKATNERGDVDVIAYNVKVRTNAESVWPGMRFRLLP